MKLAENRYGVLGIGLILSGAGLSPVSYFLLHSVPLTAAGISFIILGFACLALSTANPAIPPQASPIFLEAGLQNIAAIVEYLGLKSKAIYLPSSLTGAQSRALIPLRVNSSLPEFHKPLVRRLITQYGPRPEDIGLLVSTPGSAAVSLLESKPGATSAELELALTSILGARTDLADGVRVGRKGARIILEVSHPRLGYRNLALYECLGSPLASIAAAIAAEALEKPITISREEHKRGKSVIELEVVGESI